MRLRTFTTVADARDTRDAQGQRRPRAFRRGIAALTAGALLSVTAAGAAVADDLWNTQDGTTAVAATLDAQAEVIGLTISKTSTVGFRLQARSADIDGFNGCNVSLATPATFTFRSTNPDVATITSPATGAIQFTTCTSTVTGATQERTVDIVARGAGTTTFEVVSVTDAAGNPFTKGTFNLESAKFRVDVAPPPNSAPTMKVVGLDQREYVKGTHPAPMCQMTDAEEGYKEFPASLVKKEQGGDGLGTWIARCFYRDGAGAVALEQPEYQVIDPTPVVIRYFVNSREGDQPWIRNDVRLQWVVEDPEGPSHIKVVEGCTDQNVLSDGKHEFVCEAYSFNGQKKRVVATVLRDTTGPQIVPTVTSTPISVGGVTWYKGSATIDWATSDAHSGVVDGSLRSTVGIAPLAGRTTTVGQGRGQLARVVANDVAGNVGEGIVRDLNVDASAPTVSADVTSTPAHVEEGGKAWYKDSATVAVTASDPEVSPYERGSGVAANANPTGTKVVTQSGPFTVSATDNVGNVGWSESFPLDIDATAPTVTATCPSAPIVKGTQKTAAWKATDEGSGVAGSTAGAVRLDAGSIGTKVATVSAGTVRDNVGHDSAAATCGYDVDYPFTGFFAPIDNNGVLNQVKAGSAVPVRFSLGGNEGLSVLDGTPSVSKFTCPSSSTPVDSVEETALSTGNGLKYEALANQYNYTWKTSSTMANTCQKLTVKLVDGTSHTALFKFVK